MSEHRFNSTAVFLRELKPPDRLTVSEWADKYRYLSTRASAEPGRYRTSRTPYMKEIMDVLSAHDPTKEIVFQKCSQIGAPLALDIKVATPVGFKTIGEIKEGDEVFGVSGEAKRVIGVSEIFENDECYLVTFDDRSTVRCDGRHLWTIEEDSFRGRFTEKTLSTADIFKAYKSGNRNRYRIGIASYLKCSAKEFEIAPYALGAWLGDGNRNSNRLTVFRDDAEEIAHHIKVGGHLVAIEDTERRYDSVLEIVIDPIGHSNGQCFRGHNLAEVGTIHGRCRECHRRRSYDSRFGTKTLPSKKKFGTVLREIGVHRNKHIPDEYLRASFDQRLSLLRGLMDTDGYCAKHGLCEFSNTNRQLAEQVQHLVCSLGMRASIRTKPAEEQKSGWGIQDVHLVHFRPTGLRVFNVKRKSARQKIPRRQSEVLNRRIKKVEKVAPFQTKCLAVDSDDHLFLVGNELIPTHNTEAGNNWIGYLIDHSPAPILAIQPTVELAKRYSKQRIDPMIEDCPDLSEKVKSKRSRDSGNTVLQKDFIGGTLLMTGANSAVGLRSMPARFVFPDEIDAYPEDVDNEGSPLELARARQRTFTRRKTFYASTPTLEDRSKIARLFELSDKRYFHVPCPLCGHYQRLVWKNLKWHKDRPKTAWYECESCAGHIKNWMKTKMLKAGRWVKTAESDIAGFHLNALYSPVGWYSWEEMAEDWLRACKIPELLRSFVNTALGETWKEKTEVPDWHRLYERREQYPVGKIPKGVFFLTAGVDVQEDRLEVEVVGWGRNKVTWSIEYRVILGKTNTVGPWNELTKMMSETWPLIDDERRGLSVRLFAVDSGYATQTVYDYCRKFSPTQIVPIKGSDRQTTTISQPKAVDVTRGGRTIKKGTKVWTVGVNLLKTELYGWLRQDKAGEGEEDPPGYCHFPEYGEDFFKQLTAEAVIVRFVKGYKRPEWQKVRDRNEALDCRIYARAAAAVIGIDRFTDKHWDDIAGKNVTIESKQADSTQRAPPIRRRRSGWL